jgi:uncharacterized membrane protein YoaK (UPF0700 family)
VNRVPEKEDVSDDVSASARQTNCRRGGLELLKTSSLISNTAAIEVRLDQVGDTRLSWLEARLPPLLSVIAGMVDLTGFLTLGHVFTAHVTGNLVVATAAAAHSGPFNPAQVLAIPIFILGLAATWLVARVLHRRRLDLVSPLLLIQFLLLAVLLIFSVTGRPSTAPQGFIAGVAVMIAVSAMACQYALLRLAMPHVVSTAAMTGNLANAVLWLLDAWWGPRASLSIGDGALKRSLYLLLGFLLGCVLASYAVSVFADWAWAFPVALSGGAFAYVRFATQHAGS